MKTPETEATKDGQPSGLAVAPCSAPHYKMVHAPDSPTLCEYVNNNLLAGFVPVGGPLLVKDRLWQAMIRWPNTLLAQRAQNQEK